MRARSGNGVSKGIQFPKENSSARFAVVMEQMPVRKKFEPWMTPGFFFGGDHQDRGTGIQGVLGIVGVDHFVMMRRQHNG